MNTPLLIDSIVRQVTVLIAQLGTAGGLRAPMAHLANQVFLQRPLPTGIVSGVSSARTALAGPRHRWETPGRLNPNGKSRALPSGGARLY